MRLSSHELFKHMRRPRRGRRLTRVLQTFLFEVTPNRSDPVHDRHAAADGDTTHGGMAAGAPRDTDRPVRRAARGIAVTRARDSDSRWLR